MDRGAMGRTAADAETRQMRIVRWVIAAGALAGTFAVLTGPAASAEGCPVFPIVACPAPADPPATPTTTTTQPPATTTTIEQPTPEWARARLVALINEERSAKGLALLTARADVTNIASRWSAAMSSAGMLSHDDDYFSADTRSKLAAGLLGENVARAGDIDSAHRALMASEHHRANILDGRFTTIGVGATERDGNWWITEDFLQPRDLAGAATPSHSPRRRNVERARASEGAVLPTSPTHVSAVSAAKPHEVEVLPRTEAGPMLSVLAGEGLVDPRLRLAVVAVALMLSALVLIVRRASAPAVVRPIAELGPAPIDVVDHDVANGDIGDALVRGVQHRLAVIDAWVRTLDDRWQALSESDKRVAVQIIRRNTSAVLDSCRTP